MRTILAVLSAALLACGNGKGKPLEQDPTVENREELVGTSAEVAAPTSPSPPTYSPPPAPDWWLIDSNGIALLPQDALRGRTIAVLYSSWCPKVRESLPEFLNIVRSDFRSYRAVGLFAHDELGQLADVNYLGDDQTKAIRALLAKEGVGTGIVEPKYAHLTLEMPRYRVTREHWEALGGEPGGFAFACFNDGTKTSCPGGL